jgi:DNA-binding transcriptional ArsR family regulator
MSAADPFVTLADPTRREILRRIGPGELPAGELVRAFPDQSQPGISRHLRVLREAGLVEVRSLDRRRLYSLNRQGFEALESWIAQFRAFWPAQLDALERHLDASVPKKSSKAK